MPYKNKKKQRRYQALAVSKSRRSFLKGKSCIACGSKRDLEVDHIDPRTKITHRMWSWSKERLAAELIKCQVLCWFCHFFKTVMERAIFTCPLGHPKDGVKGDGKRYCLECARMYKRARSSKAELSAHNGPGACSSHAGPTN